MTDITKLHRELVNRVLGNTERRRETCAGPRSTTRHWMNRRAH